MYEQHFGLSERLFPPQPAGADVFAGPQMAEMTAAIRKALRSRDAVVAVSGPAGSGKSTLVARSLDALGDGFRVAKIGRIRLKGADVLEFLLEQLGVENVPRGAIRQVSLLRSALARLEAEGVQLVVVVEDASLCGAETMAELEALTAADTGDSGGAAVVLMGNERLGELLADTQLARLAQRVRQQLALKPLTGAEMRGYLLHGFRQAGGDFDASFDRRTAELVHALSGGIPRVANNILEAAMTTAAATGESPVSATTIAAVAKDEFGLEAQLAASPEPATVVSDAAQVADEVDPPEDLVGSTRPHLPRLPEPRAAAPVREPEEAANWEHEPTVEALKPDLDALEKAIALAHGEKTRPDDAIEHEAAVPSSQARAPAGPAPGVGNSPPEARESGKPEDPNERVSSGLANARTIRDIGDTLAENLFGEDTGLVARRIPGAAAGPDDDKPQDRSVGTPPVSPFRPGSSGLDMTAYERLKTVRALNADLRRTAKHAVPDPRPAGAAPTGPIAPLEPIENQFDTALANSGRAPADAPAASRRRKDTDKDDGDQKEGGFFSRFRRS